MYARHYHDGRPPASASQWPSPPRSDPVRIQGLGKRQPIASAARSLPVFRQMHFPDPGVEHGAREGLYATDPHSPEGLSMTWAAEEASRARGMTARPQRSPPAYGPPFHTREMRSAGEDVPNYTRKGSSPLSRSNRVHRTKGFSAKDEASPGSSGDGGDPDMLLDSFDCLLLPATTYSPPKTPRRSPEAGACGSSYSSLTPPSSSDIPGLTRDDGEDESDTSGSHYSSSPNKDKPLPPVPGNQPLPECNWRCGSRLTVDQFSRGTCDRCNRQLAEEILRHSLLLPKAKAGPFTKPTAGMQPKFAHAHASNTGREDSERRRRHGEAGYQCQHSVKASPFHAYKTPTSHSRRSMEPAACLDMKARKPQSPQTKRTDVVAPRYVPPASNFSLRPAKSGNLAGRRQMNGNSSKAGPGAVPLASSSPKRSPHVFTQFSAKPGEGGPPLYPKPLALRRPVPDRQSPQAGYERGATPRSCPVESTSATDVMFVVSPNGTMQDQADRDSLTAWSQQLHSASSTSGSERSRGPASSLPSTDGLISAYLGLPDRSGGRQRQGGGEGALYGALRATAKPSTGRVEQPPARSPPKKDQPRSAPSQAARIAPREPWPGMPGPATLNLAGQSHADCAFRPGRLPPIVSEPDRPRAVRAQSPAKSLPPIKFDTSRRRPACDRL